MPETSIESKVREMDAMEIMAFLTTAEGSTSYAFGLCNKQYWQLTGELLPHLNIED